MTRDIVFAILEIFGVFFVGWGARHLKYIDDNDIKRSSRLILDFLFPMLGFSVIVGGFEADRFNTLWPLPFIGLGMIVFGAIMGIVLRLGLRTRDPDIRKTFHHFCAVNNYGFLPIIIIGNLWGEAGVAKLFVMNLGSSVGYWTIGVALLGEADLRKTARKILAPNLIAVLLALAICFSGLKQFVPEIVIKITGNAGGAAVPLMLVLIGASLYPLPRVRNKWDLSYLAVVRLVALPFVIILVLSWLPLAPDVRNLAYIVALMPVTISSPIITRHYGGSPDFAARASVYVTLASMITIPAALFLLTEFAPSFSPPPLSPPVETAPADVDGPAGPDTGGAQTRPQAWRQPGLRCAVEGYCQGHHSRPAVCFRISSANSRSFLRRGTLFCPPSFPITFMVRKNVLAGTLSMIGERMPTSPWRWAA